MDALRAKLALFKMIDQFMYSGVKEDGTEYFDDYCESAGEMAFTVLGFEDDRVSKEEFYAAYDKLLAEIAELNGTEVSFSHLEYYKSEWEKKQARSKSDVLFEATQTNWGLIPSERGKWLSTNFIINRDGRFQIYHNYDEYKHAKSITEEYDVYTKGKLSDEDLNKLTDILSNKFNGSEPSDGDDGECWSMKSYAVGHEYEVSGYIYGVEALEEISKLILSLMEDEAGDNISDAELLKELAKNGW